MKEKIMNISRRIILVLKICYEKIDQYGQIIMRLFT